MRIGVVLFLTSVGLLGLSRLPAEEPKAKAEPKAGVEKMAFGKTGDGTPVELYVLTNKKGMTAKVMTYGAILTELDVPDKNGKTVDVVLGFDNLKGYLEGHPYFGSNVGRVANRIAKGKFTLDGKEYKLATNNGPNHLHGGKEGFDKKVWKAELVKPGNGQAVKFTYVSPDGDEGYPGKLTASVTYADRCQLGGCTTPRRRIRQRRSIWRITVTSTSPAPATATSSAMRVTINADKYTPTDDTLIPSGKIEPVENAAGP